jgi:hypothetical protein
MPHCLVHDIGRTTQHVGQDVGIQIQRDRDRRVSEHLGGHLRIDATTQEQGCGGVTQVMETDRRQSGALEEWSEPVLAPASPECSRPCRQPIRLRSLLQRLLEEGEMLLAQLRRPSASRCPVVPNSRTTATVCPSATSRSACAQDARMDQDWCASDGAASPAPPPTRSLCRTPSRRLRSSLPLPRSAICAI